MIDTLFSISCHHFCPFLYILKSIQVVLEERFAEMIRDKIFSFLWDDYTLTVLQNLFILNELNKKHLMARLNE